ncbi:MAG TPA: hypothetical protein VFE62_27140 [Gemmataceae bacterium]|nr:hypothetical protein [Gemmataceae bacterium]
MSTTRQKITSVSKQQIINYLDRAASFREGKAAKDRGTPKNAEYAERLRRVIAHAQSLPDDHPALKRLDDLGGCAPLEKEWAEAIHCRCDDPGQWLEEWLATLGGMAPVLATRFAGWKAGVAWRLTATSEQIDDVTNGLMNMSQAAPWDFVEEILNPEGESKDFDTEYLRGWAHGAADSSDFDEEGNELDYAARAEMQDDEDLEAIEELEEYARAEAWLESLALAVDEDDSPELHRYSEADVVARIPEDASEEFRRAVSSVLSNAEKAEHRRQCEIGDADLRRQVKEMKKRKP